MDNDDFMESTDVSKMGDYNEYGIVQSSGLCVP